MTVIYLLICTLQLLITTLSLVMASNNLLIRKFATVNICGSFSNVKKDIFQHFLYTYAIDIIFLQEVTNENFININGYTSIINIGTSGRGTAILVKESITLENVEMLPSGRGIVAEYQQCTLVNIYAPSGNNNRKIREEFYSLDVPYLIRKLQPTLILAGDFNCVLEATDCTGNTPKSKALEQLISNFKLIDVWKAKRTTPGYTYQRANTESRIDRIYVSENFKPGISSVDTYNVPFSDHNAVIAKLYLPIEFIERGRKYWKINNSLLAYGNGYAEFEKEWNTWSRKKNQYPDSADWWDNLVKPKIKVFFKRIAFEKKQDETNLINFYFSCINDVTKNKDTIANNRTKLNYFKTKIK